MVLGRFIGTLVGIVLALTFQSDSILGTILLILLFSLIGTGVGILSSLFTGPNISKDRPYLQDSEEYWVQKYGPELGKKAYEMWLEEL